MFMSIGCSRKNCSNRFSGMRPSIGSGKNSSSSISSRSLSRVLSLTLYELECS